MDAVPAEDHLERMGELIEEISKGILSMDTRINVLERENAGLKRRLEEMSDGNSGR